MINIYVAPKSLVALVVVAFGVLAFSNFGVNASNASVTSALRQCHANSKVRFVNCCNAVIRREGKPRWFSKNGFTCEHAAVCKDKSLKLHTSGLGAVFYRCNLRVPDDEGEGRVRY